VAVQERFLTKERLDDFTRIYVAERNRLLAEHRATMADARRELEAIDRRQMQILGYLNGGFGNVEAWKVEVRQNEMRRVELQALVSGASSEPARPALHPNMAAVFVEKIRTLAAALEHKDLEQRESARTTLRGFIDRIVVPPGDALLQVVGSLGEMLTAAGAPREAAAVGKGICGGGI
jgi:site-specific DNA recombinase